MNQKSTLFYSRDHSLSLGFSGFFLLSNDISNASADYRSDFLVMICTSFHLDSITKYNILFLSEWFNHHHIKILITSKDGLFDISSVHWIRLKDSRDGDGSRDTGRGRGYLSLTFIPKLKERERLPSCLCREKSIQCKKKEEPHPSDT